MPRCFFHVRNGTILIDTEGTELPDLETARIEAVKLAGEMLKDVAETFWSGEFWDLTVTDARDLVLFTLNFSGRMSAATADWSARSAFLPPVSEV